MTSKIFPPVRPDSSLLTARAIAMPATVVMIVVISATGCSSAPNEDPVLDFLMVGDLQGWPNHLGDDEPAIDITLVPARAFELGIPDEEVYRQSRIYFPRNWQSLPPSAIPNSRQNSQSSPSSQRTGGCSRGYPSPVCTYTRPVAHNPGRNSSTSSVSRSSVGKSVAEATQARW